MCGLVDAIYQSFMHLPPCFSILIALLSSSGMIFPAMIVSSTIAVIYPAPPSIRAHSPTSNAASKYSHVQAAPFRTKRPSPSDYTRPSCPRARVLRYGSRSGVKPSSRSRLLARRQVGLGVGRARTRGVDRSRRIRCRYALPRSGVGERSLVLLEWWLVETLFW